MNTKCSIFTSGGSHKWKYKFWCSWVKWISILHWKIKFSVSFMLLFTVIKILSTLRLSRQKHNFFPSHFASIWSCLLHKMQSRERKIIQSNSNSFEILPKVNLGHNLWANIMILARAVLETFCSQSSIGLQWESRKTSKKGHDSRTTVLTEKKKYGSAYFSCLFHISNFKVLSITVLDLCKCNGRTDTQTTDRPKPIFGGIKTTRQLICVKYQHHQGT